MTYEKQSCTHITYNTHNPVQIPRTRISGALQMRYMMKCIMGYMTCDMMIMHDRLYNDA